MAWGNRTSAAATYDVNYRVNLGQFRAENTEAVRLHEQGLRTMSTSSLKLAVAEDKLNVALARSGAGSRQAAAAELNLRRVQQELTTATHRTSGALQSEERTLGRLTRGAIAGSGVFRGLGRSLAFASGAFLGGTGLVYALRSSIKAAEDHQVVYGQLAVAVKAAGLDYQEQRRQIDQAIVAQEKLGFTEEAAVRSYITLVRATKDAAQATRLQAVAADIARATNKPLETTTNAVAKAFGNQNTQLKRLIPGLDNTKKGLELIADAQRRTAGAAQAYGETAAGAQARFEVALHRTKVTIGTELLPTVTHYLDKAADWLDKSKNQARIQHDVNVAVHAGGQAAKGLAAGIKGVNAVLHPLIDGLGGIENAAKLAFGLWIVTRLRLIASSLGLVRTQALGAAASFGTLAAAEGGAGVGGTILGFNPVTLAAVAVGGTFLFERGKRREQQAQWNGMTAQQQWDYIEALASKSGVTPEQEAAALARVGHLKIKRRPISTAYFVPTPSSTAIPLAAGSRRTASPPAAPTQPLDRASQISLQLARARASGSDTQVVAALAAQAAFDRKYITIQERLLKTDTAHRAQHAKNLQRLYSDLQSVQDEIDSIHQKAANDAASKSAAAARKQKAASDRAARAAQKTYEEWLKNNTGRVLVHPGVTTALGEKVKQKLADKTAAAALPDFKALAFGFLQTLHGFDSTVGSNVRGPTTVVVNQSFPAPTPDRHREAIFVRHALESAMQTA